MARTIPMPSISELPKGAKRDFVEELRRYYRAADRPPLRRVSEMIEKHADPVINRVTASPETVRRMITGKVLPVEVARVRAVFIIFCELSGMDPEGLRWQEYRDGGDENNWQYLRQLWDQALEEQPVSAASARAPMRNLVRSEDPWSTSDRGYSDEPPF